MRRILAALWVCASILLWPGSPSLAASDVFERGRADLEAGRYREAESAFLEVTRAKPGSASAHYYLGLSRAKRGNPQGARRALEDAVALDPNLPGAWLSLGIARYELDDVDAAMAALERAVADDPEDASAHYFLGLALQRSGRQGEARAHFDRSTRLDPSYAQLAWLQSGIAFREEGEIDAARGAIERSIAADPESETAGDALILLAALERRGEGSRRWSLYGAAGLEVDDNVSIPELDASSGEADVAGIFELGGSFRFLEGQGYEVEGSYDFYQSVYADLTEANLQSHTVTLSGLREFGWVDAGLDYRFTGSTLGGDGFLNLHQLLPSFAISPTSHVYLSVAYDFRAKDFADESARDATQNGGVFRTLWLVSEGQASIVMTYHVADENADAPEFDYLSHAVGSRFETPLDLFGVSIDLGVAYRYTNRNYSNQTPSIGRRRLDQLHFAELAFEKRFARFFVARLGYQHLTSDSNLPEADYSSNVVSLGLGFDY